MRLGAILAVAVVCSVLAGCGNSPSSSNSGDLFVATQGDSLVSTFGVNLTDGSLSASSSKVATGSAPSAMAVVPSGSAAFVANSQCVNGGTVCNSVSRYTVNSDGTLAAVSGVQAVGTDPVALAVDAAGKLLFVANRGSNNISVFTIQSGTTLTEAAGSPFPTGASPVALAVAPSGNYLYVANNLAGTVSVYAVDSSGVLSVVPGSPFTGVTSITPAGVTTTPKGDFVFVSNSGSNNVSVFAACIAVSSLCPTADGSLVEVTDSPFTAGVSPGPLAVESSGNFLYVVDTLSDQISGFRISTASGALTPISPPTVSTGAGPVSIAIHPDGLWLYTANFAAATITYFGIDTTSGALAPHSPIPTGGQPAALGIR